MTDRSKQFGGVLTVSGLASALALGLAAGTPGVSHAAFTDVTVAAGLDTAGGNRGAGWADYNDDGCVDVYVTGAAGGTLYQNNCDGTFSDVTVAAGVPGLNSQWTAAWADYDNDGDLDLYIVSHEATNVLYSNDGDGTFTDVSAAAGVDSPMGTTGATFGDYDEDGDLDIFIANRFGNFTVGDNVDDMLYQNNGDGTFTDVTLSAGVAGEAGRNSFMGAWFDYDNNGTLDLYIAVDFGFDILYSNNGDGTFTDVSLSAGITDPEHGMGLSVGDINHDGCLDIISSNNNIGAPSEHRESVLYINNCDGTFADSSVAMGVLDRETVDWGLNLVDWDNDMDLDLSIVAGGMLTSGQPNILYENPNTCNGMFFDVTDKMGVQNTEAAFGSVWVDYDDDGDLDWFVVNDSGSNKLFRNDNSVGNYLKVSLAGTTSNIDGVGAVVTATAGGVTQTKVIQSGLSYSSSEELEAHFGLGVKDMADSVTVTWPNGAVSEVTNVAANQSIEVTEDAGSGLTSFTGTTFNAGLTVEPFVRVTARESATGNQVTSIISDAAGQYTLDLPAGDYFLVGFKPGLRPSVPVDVTSTGTGLVTVDITLRLP